MFFIYLPVFVGISHKKRSGGNAEISPSLALSAFQEGEKVIWN